MCRYFWFHCKTYSVRGYLDYWSFLSCCHSWQENRLFSSSKRTFSNSHFWIRCSPWPCLLECIIFAYSLCVGVVLLLIHFLFFGETREFVLNRLFISLSIAFFFLLLTWLNSSNPSSNSFLWSTFPFLLSSYRLAKSSSLHILHVPCLIKSMSLPDSVILK